MIPQPMGAPAPATPPMPSPEQLEEDRLIAEACSWEEIAGVLHSDDRRNYTVDVETDATAFEDIETEKQQRIEYLRAMTEMMQVWVPAIQGNPTLAPLGKELAIFGSGAFKPGRQFEEQLGDAFDQIKNMPPQPNPEAEKLKAEAEREQRKFMMEAQARQQEAAAKERDRQQEMAFKEKDYQLKEREQVANLAFKEKEFAFKEAELGLKMQDARMNRDIAAEQAMADRETRAADRQARDEDRQAAREDRDFDRQHRQSELAMKREDLAERRSMAGEKADARDSALRGEVDQNVQGLARQVQQALQQVMDQQRQIAESVAALTEQQTQGMEALTAMARYMAAPRKLLKDAKTGRASGVEIGKVEGDLKGLLEQLGKGQRSFARGADGKLEAFA